MTSLARLHRRSAQRTAAQLACAALSGLLPLCAVAEPTEPRVDTDRMVELARLCLDVREFGPTGLSGIARDHGLTPAADPLPRMIRHFAQRKQLMERHYNREHNSDPAEAAHELLYPMGDPDPLMAFEGEVGWLFLVGQDATVRIDRNLKTGKSIRHTAYTCDLIGDGWISDRDAREVLADVLGENFGGYRTTPPHVNGSPHTLAMGSFDFAPPVVEAFVESIHGSGEVAPVIHVNLTAEVGRVD